jgi:hypothetical protein
LRSASSKTLYLLASLAALGIVAWTAQHGPSHAPLTATYTETVTLHPKSTVTLTFVYGGVAGKGFFAKVKPGIVDSGVDTLGP